MIFLKRNPQVCNLHLLVTIVFLSAQFNAAKSDVVLINVHNELDTSKDLSICALKKPFVSNDTDIRYPFVQIKQEMSVCQQFVNASIIGSAVFVSLNYQLQCPFDTLAQVLQANDPALVLVGSDGPFRFDSLTVYKSSFLFFPQFMADKLIVSFKIFFYYTRLEILKQTAMKQT